MNTKLTGTLLLDWETVKTAPNLFALQALMLRSAGMKVVIFGEVGCETSAARMGISFHDFVSMPLAAGKKDRDTFKFETAMELLKGGPVLWPDLSLHEWKGGNVNSVPGLVVVNWHAVMSTGFSGSPLMQA